jgi:hypothetical protein
MKRIVVSGIYYAVTAALEYFVRAFERRNDCEVITVGPYAGLHMPWSKNGVAGMIMPEKYDFRPDIVLPLQGFGQHAPISIIENKVGKVDLWLDVNAGFYLQGKPKTGIRATFLTDPHVLRGYYDGLLHNYEYVFCSQTPYARVGEHYLPYACDSEWHKPLENVEKIYDVALIGNYYPHRVTLVERLRAMGMKVFFDIGYAKDDMQLIYNQSKIGLNWSTLDDLNARVFELMGLGLPSVMNTVTDMNDLFESGKDYLSFSTPEQAIELIKHLLANEEIAKNIGENARNKIISDGHTWDDRVETIIKICDLTD